MEEIITSAQNPKIKRLLALQQKSSERRESGLFVVEGRRELEHCIEAGYEIDTLFVCPSINNTPLDIPEGTKIFDVSTEVYEKIAYRSGTEGLIAEVRTKSLRLEDLQLGDNPLIVVLESVEKPGNLGAVLRSADASGADAVIVCDPWTDLYNPNLIRSSIGAIFTVPCVACSSEECIAFLKARGIKAGQRIPIHKWMNATGGGNKVTIGMTGDCEIQMNWEKSNKVAKEHAQLYVDPTRKMPVIKPLANGVVYNTRAELPVGKPSVLTNGDTFKIGDTIFKYEETD